VGRFLTVTYTWARRCTIALIGGTIVLIGVLMIVFPGPAFIVIPAGLAILGIEFACARRWLKQLRTTGTQVINRTGRWLRPWRRNAREPEAVRRSSGTTHRSAAATDRVKANTKTGY
jgi:tellurite resistance protein TerC